MQENLPWYSVWKMALTRPGSQAFVELTNQPKATKQRAYSWAFIGSIGFALSLFSFTEPNSDYFRSEYYLGESVGLAVFLVFGFVLMTVFVQTVAVTLGGKGSRSQLAYAFATYIAPLGVISGILSFVPLVKYLIIPLGVYGLILNTIATKATH